MTPKDELSLVSAIMRVYFDTISCELLLAQKPCDIKARGAA